jgi:azobenzene reductase
MVWLAPEYNGGYPGAFKNAFDHFRAEYTKKPVGICCVSDGKFAGIQASLQLQTLAVHVGAYVCPTKWLVGNVSKVFDAQNKITDELTAKGLDRFIQEYLWLARAIVEHKKKH